MTVQCTLQFDFNTSCLCWSVALLQTCSEFFCKIH